MYVLQVAVSIFLALMCLLLVVMVLYAVARLCLITEDDHLKPYEPPEVQCDLIIAEGDGSLHPPPLKVLQKVGAGGSVVIHGYEHEDGLYLIASDFTLLRIDVLRTGDKYIDTFSQQLVI